LFLSYYCAILIEVEIPSKIDSTMRSQFEKLSEAPLPSNRSSAVKHGDGSSTGDLRVVFVDAVWTWEDGAGGHGLTLLHGKDMFYVPDVDDSERPYPGDVVVLRLRSKRKQAWEFVDNEAWEFG
jgi:hypothetical protein